MLSHELLRDRGVLVVRPRGRLIADDFARIGAEVDPWIEERGFLAGVLVHTRKFPGYANLRAFRAHMRFLRSHGETVRRLAIVTDGKIFSRVPAVVNRILPPEVRHFPYDEDEKALAWLSEAGKPG